MSENLKMEKTFAAFLKIMHGQDEIILINDTLLGIHEIFFEKVVHCCIIIFYCFIGKPSDHNSVVNRQKF